MTVCSGNDINATVMTKWSKIMLVNAKS